MTDAPVPAPTRVDERRHLPGDDPWWCESWDYDFATPDAALGGYVRLDVLPNRTVCWYAAALVGQHRDLVAVVDHDVALPRSPGLEVRTEGLWADHIVEEPLDHVSVGCEAFALRLDDAAEALAVPLLGERTPFGLDLGWETEGLVVPIVGGYALPCRVVGEVLVGDDRIELDAFGWRRHTWDATVPGRPRRGGSPDGMSLPGETSSVQDDGEPWSSTRGRVGDGIWLYDEEGLEQPTRGYDLDPVAEAPTPLVGSPPRHLARTLCRLIVRDAPADRIGAAWSDHIAH
ncbi:MAG: hypothetical protein ACRD2C_26845, partial [Acidimicrobiales bacterium]